MLPLHKIPPQKPLINACNEEKVAQNPKINETVLPFTDNQQLTVQFHRIAAAEKALLPRNIKKYRRIGNFSAFSSIFVFQI